MESQLCNLRSLATLPTASAPKRSTLKSTCICLVLSLFAAASAHATTTVFSGTFANDSSQFSDTFTLTATSSITIETESYGGGKVNGSSIASGGFLPELTLFGPTGNTLASDGGDGTCQAGMTVLGKTGLCNDALITTTLGPGSYEFVLTEFGNYAGTNLSQGFTAVGPGTNFTAGVCGQATGNFYEIDQVPCPELGSSYAVSLTTPTTSTPGVTPEPPSVALLAMPLFGLAYLSWRRSQLSF